MMSWSIGRRRLGREDQHTDRDFGKKAASPPSRAGKQLRAHAGQAIDDQTDPFVRRRIRPPQALAERRESRAANPSGPRVRQSTG